MPSGLETFVDAAVCNVSLNILNLAACMACLLTSLVMVTNACVHTRYLKKHSKNKGPFPKLALILPCKGVREGSREAWESQLKSGYKGEMQLIFVTESAEDPAHVELKELIQMNLPANRSVELVVAGQTWHNSQKIHNMLAGMRHADADAKYILVADDDISANGEAFAEMAQGMGDPRTICATGYSIEIPARGGSFGSYLVTTFRAIQLMGYVTQRPAFLWGGCYMLRRDYLFGNVDSYTDMLRDGTYSEDMTLNSILSDRPGSVFAPYSALFPNVLPARYSVREYVAFLRRQYFVMRTYHIEAHRLNNILNVLLMALVIVVFNVPVVLFLVQIVVLSVWAATADTGTSQAILPCWTNVGLMITWLVCVCVLGLSSSFMIHSFDKMAASFAHTRPHSVPNPVKMSLAFFVHFFVMPFMAVRSPLSDNVVWSGIKFVVRGGRVSRMYRPDESGAFVVTRDPGETLLPTTKADYDAGLGFAQAPESSASESADVRENVLTPLCQPK